ncbi:OmpP1/FadL family transporter [Winogradskyella sp. PG-2]|uniref:OmpP1/FadL family transporter n=1 Tax=Winogradskyella sp. PG-2 TaxID=754409 RepID=UPI0004585CEF|nr:outer membrane protein transport protein [Winogradskyella sp. PG-2]BAO74664.1 putative hemin receptor [Winogradskyella sp. PG-2]
MKKILMLCIGLISTSQFFAQDVTDAVRYSQDEIQGTARFRAMSGAFGALGGDMSSININPAGSAIFNNSHASISLGLFDKNNDVTYNTNNATNSFSNSNVDLNQLGAAFVFRNTNIDSPWKKFTLGITYDRSSDFNDEWVASGTNTNSIDSYFLSFTNNSDIPFGILKLQQNEFIEEAYADIGTLNNGYDIQQAFLGYWSGIIDPMNLDDNTNDDETNYVSNIAPGNFNQDYLYSSTGYNGKLAFNFATEYDEKIFFGLNLNAHFINYEKFTRFNETNSNTGSVVENLAFENLLTTNGSGFSFQLGTIVKLTKQLRAGVSYNSPTWYRVNEELIQGISSNNADPEINFISDVINIYPEYKLQTPGKITGSLAYVFGKKGLLSFDYSVKDYTDAKFRPTTDAIFSSLNNELSNVLTTASTYKFGGEYRHKQFSFRGGYRFEESPYKDDTFYGDLTGYSLGLGYSFGDFNLDIAYSQAERDTNYQLFSSGLTDTALIQSKFTDVILTLGFRI